MHAPSSVSIVPSSLAAHRGRPRLPRLVALSFLFALCCGTAAMPAAAGTIYWSMQSLSPTSTTEPGISASSLSQGNTSVTGTSQTVSSNVYTFSLDGTQTSASGAGNLQFRAVAGVLSLGTSAFVELTVSNTSGGAKFLTGFGFGSRSTATGPQAYSLLASTDAFQTHQTLGTGALVANSVWAYQSHSFVTPLSLTAQAPLTLRLYAYGGTSAANGNWRIDDLQVMAVPEPAAAGCMGVLAVVIAVAMRPRRHPTVRQASRT